MTDFSWMQFALLWGMGIFGAIAVIPYAFNMQRELLAEAPMPLWKIALLSSLQTGVLLAILIGLGLLLSQQTGLGTPLLSALLAGESLATLRDALPLIIMLGLGGTFAMLTLEFGIFQKHLPQKMREQSKNIPIWQRLLASFYGGITEEIIVRLFVMNLLAWLLGFVWSTEQGLPSTEAIWLANFGAAIIFGLLHLPATKALAGKITPMLFVRAILLNGIGGVIFGYLYWRYGLLAAMVAHFSFDIALHVVTPFFTKASSRSTAHNTLTPQPE